MGLNLIIRLYFYSGFIITAQFWVTELVLFAQIVLNHAPQGKVKFENGGKCIRMAWKAPRDNGGVKVTNFITENRLTSKVSCMMVKEVNGDTITIKICLAICLKHNMAGPLKQ